MDTESNHIVKRNKLEQSEIDSGKSSFLRWKLHMELERSKRDVGILGLIRKVKKLFKS